MTSRRKSAEEAAPVASKEVRRSGKSGLYSSEAAESAEAEEKAIDFKNEEGEVESEVVGF